MGSSRGGALNNSQRKKHHRAAADTPHDVFEGRERLSKSLKVRRFQWMPLRQTPKMVAKKKKNQAPLIPDG